MSERETQILVDLLIKYQRNELSEAERSLLQAWRKEPGNEKIFERLTNDEHFVKELKERQQLKEVILQTINDRIEEADFQEKAEKADKSPVYRKMVSWKWIAAAAILFCTLTVAYLETHRKKAITYPGRPIAKSDILAPIGSKAILTLSDGSDVVIDSVESGTLAHQGNTNVSKLANGQIAYHALKSRTSGDLTFNKLSTSRGGQTALVLSDGTKVWLNASSSIKYPISFFGANRTVQVTGEAYFEIAKNKNKPFHVAVDGGVEIEVLGTRFNVNSYTDEPSIKTTLLEGSIRIKKGNEESLLKPGNEAQVTNAIKIIDKANTEDAVSWKNGITSFKNADIRSIMRKVMRWYDIEVVYSGKVPEKTFVGGIPRNANLSDLLKVLRINGINFLIEGRKITITQ